MSLSKAKSLHTQQCQELHHQIELLQDDNEAKMTQLTQSEQNEKKAQDEVNGLERALQDKQEV